MPRNSLRTSGGTGDGTTPKIVLLPLQSSFDGSPLVSSPLSLIANNDKMLQQQQQQQQQPALGATTKYYDSQQDYSVSSSSSSSSSLPAGVPMLQVYVSLLAFCAVAWLLYLLVPRGWKKAYFDKRQLAAAAARKRNKKTNNDKNKRNTTTTTTTMRQTILSSAGATGEPNPQTDWLNVVFQAKQKTQPSTRNTNSVAGFSNFTHDSVLAATEARRKRDLQREQEEQNSTTLWHDIPIQQDVDNNDDNDYDNEYSPNKATNNNHKNMFPMSMATSERDLENHQTPAKQQQQQQQQQQSRYYSSIVPSPNHPQINPLPSDAVWRECYRRLQGTGMRLTAHGVQCPSKRIWLSYSAQETTLLWQTEFPKQVPSTAVGVSTVWVRGAMHRIPAGNVLYIDVGKKTTALLQTSHATVAPSTCFSLLTQAGSLDLQANSKLERDAVVCALSYILDMVHQGSDWRRLYDESSTIVNGGGRTGTSVAGTSSSSIPQYNPSAVGAISNIGSDMFPPGPNEI